MEAEAPDGVAAVAVFMVALHGVPDVLHVYADLVLATGLEFQLHEGACRGGLEGVVVRDGVLATTGVFRRGVGDVGFVVLEPRLDGAVLAFHLASDNGDITAVEDDLVPVLFQDLGDLDALGVHHQAAGVAIEAVHGVGRAFEVALGEVLVEDLLGGVLLGGGGHREDAHGFLDDDEVFVLIDNLHVLVLQQRVMLVLAHAHGLTGVQGFVVAGGVAAVYGDAVADEDVLGAVTGDAAELLHQELQEGGFLANDVFAVF